MSSDVVKNFENLFSCEYFYDTIRYGFQDISITISDNLSLWQNFQSFHSRTNTLIFVFICGFFFALLSWILSLITGLCTWVNIKIITKLLSLVENSLVMSNSLIKVDKLWSIFPIIYALHFTIHDYGSSDETTPYSIRLWIVTVS